MAPYRTAAATGGIIAPSLTAVASGVAAAWHPWIGIAVAVLLVVQYLDIVSGTRAARVAGTYRKQRRDRALADKLLRDTQLIGALLFDIIFISAGATTFFFVTAGATGFLIRDEWRSYRRNMRAALGEGAVWDGFDQVDGRLAALAPDPPKPSDP